MSAAPTDWTQWQSQVVNGVFPLRRFLGATNHGAVFLTEYKAKNLADAAIKFVPADASHAETQLAQWRTVAELSHPHLVRLFEVGRYQAGGRDFLFVVMEHAEQTLAQILGHRALSADEVREILPPALDALAFLHRNHLLHGQLKPSNFLAVNDQLKLASDTVRPAGNSVSGIVRTSSYDPPELQDRGRSTAGDVWGFGMTLVEALTQRTIASPGEHYESASLPATFPASFADTARRCLSLDPANRPTVIELEAQYNPGSQTPSPAPAISDPPARAEPSSIPDPPAISEPPAISDSPSIAKPSSTAEPSSISEPPAISAPPSIAEPSSTSEPSLLADDSPPKANAPRKFLKRDLLLPAIAVAILVALAVWIGRDYSGPLPYPLQPRAVPAPAPVVPSRPAPSPPAPSPAVPSPATPSADVPLAVATPDPAPSNPVSRASEQPPVPPAATSSAVLHEAFPDIPQKIREKVKGRIYVTVRVLVDPSGNVIGTLIEKPGRSRYFAQLAEKAAGEWKFVPTDKRGSRVWLLRFTFTRDGTTVRTTAV